MNSKNKLFILCALALGAMAAYVVWFIFRPVEIVAVHQSEEYSDVLVRNFPLTDKGKIAWWQSNHERIKKFYAIPKPAQDGYYSIVFWDFADGYKEEGNYDRRCFPQMKVKAQCIDKNKLLSLWRDKDGTVIYGVNDGEYRMTENGKLISEKYR